MDINELVKNFEIKSKEKNWGDLSYIELATDGSGNIIDVSYIGDEDIVFYFNNTDELVSFLNGEKIDYLVKVRLYNKKDDINIDKYIILKSNKELTSKQIIDIIKDNIELPENFVLEDLWELIRDYEVIEYTS